MRIFLRSAFTFILASMVSIQSSAAVAPTSPISPAENPVLARFDKQGTVTEADLLAYLERRGTTPKQMINDDPLLDTLPLHLGRIAARKILAASAETTGMAQDPDYRAETGDILREILAKELVNREFELFLPIPEAAAREYFESHPDEFRLEPQVWFRHIFLPLHSPIDPQQLVSDLRAGKLAFATAATRYSTGAPPDELANVLGPIKRNVLLPELEAVAFSIQLGGIADPIRTERGTEIIQVTQRQEELDFDAVKRKVNNRIRTDRSKRFRDYLTKLRAKSELSQVPEIVPHLQDRDFEIARANDQVFTVRDFYAFVPRRTWSLEPEFSEKDLQGIVTDMLDRYLLAQEAKSRGLDQDEKIQQEYQEFIAFHLRQMTFERFFKPPITAMNQAQLNRSHSTGGTSNEPYEDSVMKSILELGGYRLEVQAAEQLRRRWLQQALEK